MNSKDVKAVVEKQFKDFVKDLEYITNIDSSTGEIEGSRKIAEWLKTKISALGGKFEVRDNGRGAHVIARFKGKGNKHALFVVHTDTVLNTDGGKWLFSIDENNIARGPGVGDCKASAVQMLYMMKAMKELGIEPYSDLVIFFDSEEETGSADEDAIAQELAKASDYSIVCDTGRPGWGVCTRRKGKASYKITVKGHSGHAGNAPQATANAVAEAGILISKFYALTPIREDPMQYTAEALAKKGIKDHGQFIPDNFINIATVETTNKKYNIIPDNAVIGLEVRCYEEAELERLDREIRKICANTTVPATEATVEGGIQNEPMQKDAKAAVLFETYKKIVKEEYGADVVEWTAGGLTIGNVTSKFVPTIDALGVDVEPMCEHSTKEYTDLNTFAPRTVALIHLLDRVDKLG